MTSLNRAGVRFGILVLFLSFLACSSTAPSAPAAEASVKTETCAQRFGDIYETRLKHSPYYPSSAVNGTYTENGRDVKTRVHKNTYYCGLSVKKHDENRFVIEHGIDTIPSGNPRKPLISFTPASIVSCENNVFIFDQSGNLDPRGYFELSIFPNKMSFKWSTRSKAYSCQNLNL